METSHLIDWDSQDNEVLFNPRIPFEERRTLLNAIHGIDSPQAHVWIATSGSSGNLKWTLLSKKAILESARAVNRHLLSTSSDVWFNVLPHFHVGGLGVIARGLLSNAKVIHLNSTHWHPEAFVAELTHSKATLTSLVPTQIFDLVFHHLNAPRDLRAVIVGGGTLSESLYEKALCLGWKLLPSYGLTECASQVATASLDSWEGGVFPSLTPLDHVKLMLDEQGYLKIESPSLLTAYANVVQSSCVLTDPKSMGWFKTEDKPIIDNQKIVKIQRAGSFVKIGGESVDLLRLEKILEEIKLALKISCDVALIAREDARLGHMIHLAVASSGSASIHALVEDFNQKVLPFERIRQTHHLSKIPRSPLQKVLRQELLAEIDHFHNRNNSKFYRTC